MARLFPRCAGMPASSWMARAARWQAMDITGAVETCEAVLNARGVELEALPARPGAPPRDFIATLPGEADTSLLFEAFAAAGEAEPACLLSGLQPHEENLETIFERVVGGAPPASPPAPGESHD